MKNTKINLKTYVALSCLTHLAISLKVCNGLGTQRRLKCRASPGCGAVPVVEICSGAPLLGTLFLKELEKGEFVCALQVGADVGMHVGANFIESFPERVVKSHIIPLLNKAGRLGEKTGKGLYKYDKRKQIPDPDGVQPILQESQQKARLGEV